MDNKGSKYYFSRLDDGEKNLYNKICDALLGFEPAVSLHCGTGQPYRIDIEKIFFAVMFDNPVFFYVNRERVMIKETPMYITLTFNYDYDREEAEKLWTEINERADRFVSERIRKEMSPLAKQLEIHRFVTSVTPARPPYSKDCFSVVGAFINGTAVCEGYSKAYKLLCDRVGIASLIVVGKGTSPDGVRENHAWNITRIRDITAHTDATWDARYGVSNYDYFNISDADISADHTFDPEKYPECKPNKINYFYKNGLIASDESELFRLIESKRNADSYSIKLLFELEPARMASLPFGKGKLGVNASQNVISFFKE